MSDLQLPLSDLPDGAKSPVSEWREYAFTSDDPRAIGRDHNQPPLSELLAEETAALRNRAGDLVAAAGRAFVEDEETAAKATTLAAMLKAHRKAVDTAREERKKPFLDAGRTVDAHFGAIAKSLDEATAKITGMVNAFLNEKRRKADEERRRLEEEARKREEDARRAAQEAARTGNLDAEVQATMRATEAASLQAQANAVAKPQIVGDYGTKAVGRTVWKSEVQDPKKVFAHLLKVDAAGVTAALADMVAKQVRAGVRDIPGARIWDEQAVTIR